jgi:IrrE N-terminal-like domain
VDVERVASELAEIEADELPGKWDALLVRSRGRRARIILSSTQQNTNRRRFTLAHELAHLVLPWSLGTAFCHVDQTYSYPDALIRQAETEANRFAAELLVPYEWAAPRVGGATGNLAELILQLAREARASPIVAMLSAVRACDPGVLLAQVDAFGRVRLEAAAPGTLADLPAVWDARMQAQLANLGARVDSADYDNGVLVSVTFPRELPLDHMADAEANSSGVLQAILSDVFGAGTPEAMAASRKINGIIGAANNNVPKPRTAEQVMSALLQRLALRADLQAVVAHAQFGQFVSRKATEIATRS